MKNEILRSLKPREMDHLLRSMARYTRFVLFSKAMLWGIALGLAILIIVLPLTNPEQAGVRIMFSKVEMTESESAPKMLKPHFQGVSNQNEPFTITADYATQLTTDTVQLHALKADITLEDSHWAALTAEQGIFDIPAKTANLQGMVKLFHDQGYTLEAQDVTLRLHPGEAESRKTVKANGPAGSLEATGFDVYENGNRLLFTGPVHVVLFTEQKGPL